MQTTTIAGLAVEVHRKQIKNLHLSVNPPHGRVRIAVPNHVTDDAIQLAVIDKLSWIKRQQQKFQEQDRQGTRQYLSGETHYFFGQKYRMQVTTKTQYKLEFNGKGRLTFHVPKNSTTANREAYFQDQCRTILHEKLAPLVQKWAQILHVAPPHWQIRRMKTKWGSCNHHSKRILFNLELVKKHPSLIEYVVLHELAHLLAPNHGTQFINILNTHMPNWELRRSELNQTALSTEAWN